MLRASWRKTVGYCWRTQKCRNVGLQHAFFEEKKAGETCARKSTSRTLKPRSVDLRPTNRLAALGSDNGRPCNPGMDALLNDGALEFREDTEHWKSAFPAGVLNLPRLYLSAQAQPNRTAVVRTRMPGGGGGVTPRGVPLSRSLPLTGHLRHLSNKLFELRKRAKAQPGLQIRLKLSVSSDDQRAGAFGLSNSSISHPNLGHCPQIGDKIKIDIKARIYRA